MKHHIEIREKMRPYTREVMQRASCEGRPVIRPLFYNFPQDKEAWKIQDQILYGDDILAAPVTEAGQRMRKVYLPAGCSWIDAYTSQEWEGGQWIEADAPIEKIPVFLRADRAAELKQIFA